MAIFWQLKATIYPETRFKLSVDILRVWLQIKARKPKPNHSPQQQQAHKQKQRGSPAISRARQSLDVLKGGRSVPCYGKREAGQPLEIPKGREGRG